MYCVPRLAMNPESIALLPTRRHKSRARSVVRRSSGERPMKVRVVWTRAGGTTRKKGDWSRSTASACFKVPSNTGSPVVFAKSARTTVSFSVSVLAWRERRNNPPPMRLAISAVATTIEIVHDLFWTARVGPVAGLTAPDEPAATAAAEAGETACVTGFDPDSCAAATDPELAATARPVSVSRFRRCRSVRMSAACW